MAENEQIVNVPAVAGLDRYTDPNNLQPPSLLEATNLTVFNKGELRTRRGFSLVEGTSGEPATAFDGDSVPSDSVEATTAYVNADGERTVLAAGSKLYEYVGSDATHGWRTVNRLPEHVGLLHAVTATGGSVIEIDSLPSPDGALILTVWVTGQRTGQELTADLVYRNPPTAGTSGNVVYYAVQREVDRSFAVQPTVLFENVGSLLCNLRITQAFTSASDYFAVVAIQSGFSARYKTVNFSTLSVTGPHTFGTCGQQCFRAFDVTGIPYSVLGSPAVVVAYSSSDTASSVNPAQMNAEVYTINPATGVPGFNSSNSDVLAKAPPGAGVWFRSWAHRGLVLEQEPSSNIVALTARVITREYSAPAVATSKLDGQLWTILLNVAGGSLTVEPKNAQVPYVGFQTQDNHANVLGTPSGTQHYSGSVQMLGPIVTTVGLLLTPATATNTPVTVTGVFPDGTIQTYIGITSLVNVAPPGQPISTVTTITGMEPNVAGYSPSINQTVGIGAGFPRPTHNYPQDAPQAIALATDEQVTRINIAPIIAGLTGFTPGTHTGCQVQSAAGVICLATVYVNAAGNVAEIAIQDGRPGVAGAAANTPTPITNIVIPRPAGPPFAWPVGALAYTYLVNYVWSPSGLDVPNMREKVPVTNYSQDGQLEHCVHRWDVTQMNDNVYIALSSVSAVLSTTPNGDSPYGAASPHAQNNMFEVYRWDKGSDRLLIGITGSINAGVMTAALGGPWRMIAGLRRNSATNELFTTICPGGDSSQRSAFMVRISAASSFSVTFPALGKAEPTSSDYVYEGNEGIFVESCNMMRITSAPINAPGMRARGSSLQCGAMRDGSSRGTQELFVLEYERSPQDWRRLIRLSDYVFANGGTLSLFDGVTANEANLLLWPQRDMTSVYWPKVGQDVYIVTEQGSQQNVAITYTSNAFYDRRGNQEKVSYGLQNITRPYFKYEAGLLDRNGFNNPNGCGWSTIKTTWGGNPAENYETVYADPRASQMAYGRASYANGWNEAAEQKQHYYGRYQATPRTYSSANKLFDVGNAAWLLWAPRSAAGWATPRTDEYTPATAGGDFLMRWTYEYTDGTGRMVRSAASSPTQYTVCAEILGAMYDHANTSASLPYTGGTVTEFRWGFFAPRIELTNRLKTAIADSQRVSLQPYTSAEPYSTVLYRMPLSTWANPSGSFVLPRNQTRGVVPYSGAPYGSQQPLGFVVSNFTLFDGPSKDYNGLLSEPYLYTTGNILDNVPPPACKAMCVHQNRLVIGGADDPTVIWFTKELNPTDAPGFNDTLTFTVEDGGAVTGLASLENSLIVFKRGDIFVISGTMPDSTGYAPSLSPPICLPHGIGCRDHRSVVETPIGVFFLSSRTIELLTPNFELQPVGLQFNGMDGFDTVTVTSASVNAERQEVYFTYYTTSDPLRRSAIAVFNYAIMGWVRWTQNVLGDSWLMTQVDGVNNLITAGSNTAGAPQALLYRESDTYADKIKGNDYRFIGVTLLTAPFAMHNIQGYERAKRASILLNQVAGSYPAIQVQVRGPAQSPPQIATWTSTEMGSLMTSTTWSGQLEVHVSEQKNRFVTLGVVTSGTGAADNIPLRIAGYAFRIGLKQGFNKRTTETARH